MSINQVADFLLSRDNFEILTHAYPDGDTLGSGYGLCLALQQLGKNARVITANLPKDFVFLTEGVKEQSFEAQTFVSVDVADEKLLGSNFEKYHGKIELCIDHHRINRVEADIKLVEPEAAANCEILYRLFGVMNVEITKFQPTRAVLSTATPPRPPCGLRLICSTRALTRRSSTR